MVVPQLRVCGETLGLSILGFWSRALGLFSADHHNDQDQAAIQTAMAPNHFVISGAGPGEAAGKSHTGHHVALQLLALELRLTLSHDDWVCSRLQSSDVIRGQIGAPLKLSSV